MDSEPLLWFTIFVSNVTAFSTYIDSYASEIKAYAYGH